MEKDTQSRKWQLTINNPAEKGFTQQHIKELVEMYKSLEYYCMSDEVGEEGTYHTHVYIKFTSAVRFSTLKNDFDGAHFEMARGTSEQNREYVFKEGKWKNDKKAGTNIRESHIEYGDCPLERQGQRNDLRDLYDAIKEGKTNFQILEENPEYMMCIDKVERARQIYKEEQFKNTWRNLEVYYLCGATGTGKTRYVMEKYGYANVYRITDYLHGWDNYKGQDVVIFEEFRSSYKIQDMLNYLDGYPLELPCRYANKIACYTKVYIITNIDLNKQYEEVQEKHNETFRALLRRINFIKLYDKAGNVNDYDFNEDKDFIPCYEEKMKAIV